jgi:hypothetical protein
MAKGRRGGSHFGTGFATGTIIGSGGGGSGGALFGSCRSDDDTFYCRLTRFTSILTQLIQIAVIGYLIFMAFEYLKGSKK